MASRLRVPSARGVRSAALEVESTRVQTLADGKKLIDVTVRRAAADGGDTDKLVMPQFDDDSSSSSSDDGSSPPVSPVLQRHAAYSQEEEEEDGDPVASNNNSNSSNQSSDASQTLAYANAALHGQVQELKAEIKSLQIQLEALAPVPGLNAAAVQDLLLDKAGAEHDIRDAKIVHQAKTLRQLKRAIQRDKQLVADALKQRKALETAKAALEKENETLTLKLARFQARAAADSDGVQPQQQQPPTEPAKEKDSTLRRKYDDLRIKHDKLQAELKKTQRALVREVGEEVNLEELVDNDSAKRGRAQQIVMLKAKVKKLESELHAKAGGEGGDVAKSDVDSRAQQEITVQLAQRQRMMDKLTSERDDLQERVQQLTKRLDGAKSRAQTLEKERQDHKAKLQLLVDKSRNDDALVDALQKQLELWKAKMDESKRARTAESTLPKDDRLELERLRTQVNEYKRQSGNNSTPVMATTEVAQFRIAAAEKERMTELIKSLQAQIEDKDRQLRQLSQSDGSGASQTTRIPRPGMNGKSVVPLTTAQYFPVPPASDSVSVDALKKALAVKDQELEALKAQVTQATQAQQEVQDLQEENDYLRQEFDRLKTRYETVLKQSRSTSSLKQPGQ